MSNNYAGWRRQYLTGYILINLVSSLTVSNPKPTLMTGKIIQSFNKLLLRTCSISGVLSFMGLRRYSQSIT